MKKLFSLLLSLAVLCCAFCLSGCHGSRGLEPFAMPAGGLDPDTQYEITFWAKNDTNKAQTDIYQSAISGFRKLYPNIKVNIRLYTDYGRIYNDVITNIATGTTPNVCITYPDHIATYITGRNIVVPLDDLMNDPDYGLGGGALEFDSPAVSQVVPEYLAEGRIGDRIYALPYMRSTEACYVNKTYVEQLGYTLPDVLTWDFVWEVSEAAMAKNPDGTFKVNGQKVMIPFIYKSTDNMMITMLRQQDAGYSDEDGTVLIFNDTARDILKTVSEHAATGAFSTFKISSYPANFLNAGQCIFAIDSTAGATWMGTDAPLLDIPEDQIVEFETAVMPVPQYDTSRPVMMSQGPSICVFNKQDSGEVLASWLFAQYLLTDDVQIAYSETEGYTPVTLRARENPGYVDYLSRIGEDTSVHYDVKINATRLLLENTENTLVTPVFNGSASLRDAAGQMIEEVTKAVRRKQTVDDYYVGVLYDNMNSLYRLDSLSASRGDNERRDLGALPKTSVTLIVTLISVWVLIGVYVLWDYLKNKRVSDDVK